MASRRLSRQRGKGRKKKSFYLDITSLLDILVILLVFLLKNYNAANVIIHIPENITLPQSQSRTLNTQGVLVQVSNEKIWVDDKNVLDSSKKYPRVYDDNGQRIIALYNELVAKKDSFKLLEKTTHGDQKFTGNINLVVDRKVKYSYLKKLMYTCASAGYKTYKFVVMGAEE